jgi:type IV secretory pathway VirB10-like protein
VSRQGSNRRDRSHARGAAYALGALLILGSAAVAAGDAEVYKWVDDNGVVHYSDVPDNARAVETGIRYGRTNAARVEQEQAQQLAAMREQAQADDARREERRAAEARQAEDSGVQADRCAAARERAKRYATAHRLYEPLPNGDRRYLSDEETTAAREAAELEIEEWCR